jgi:hypothetical protein
MRVLSSGLCMIHEVGKYTCATAEYTGRVSYGMLKLAGRAIKGSVLRVTAPLGRGLMKPFASLKEIRPSHALRRIGRHQANHRDYVESRFNSVDEQLQRIEEKLALLERHGIPSRTRALFGESPPTKIDQAKHALLRQIVEANIVLRTAESEE